VTVQTEFSSWQSGRQPGPPFNASSPNLMALLDYLQKRWGGQNLGCYGIRPVRLGSAWSSHAFGAALDWRWVNPGPGRLALENEILPFLIGNSKELGVQAVHDYVGGRIWRPPGTNGRPIGSDGWKAQPKDSAGMGQPWAGWLHIEVLEQAWGDSRPVDAKIAQDPVLPKPTLRTGDTGPEVARLIDYLRFFGWVKVKPGTVFTPAVRRGVKRMQTALGRTPDGIYGPMTAAALDDHVRGKR